MSCSSENLTVRSEILNKLKSYCDANASSIVWPHSADLLYVLAAEHLIGVAGDRLNIWLLPHRIEYIYDVLFWQNIKLSQFEKMQIEDFVSNHLYPSIYEAMMEEISSVFVLGKDRLTTTYNGLMNLSYNISKNFYKGVSCK